MKNFVQHLENKFPNKKPIASTMRLKEDLDLDSIDLVNLAIEIHRLYGVDLGEIADQGHALNTVGEVGKWLDQK